MTSWRIDLSTVVRAFVVLALIIASAATSGHVHVDELLDPHAHAHDVHEIGADDEHDTPSSPRHSDHALTCTLCAFTAGAAGLTPESVAVRSIQIAYTTALHTSRTDVSPADAPPMAWRSRAPPVSV